MAVRHEAPGIAGIVHRRELSGLASVAPQTKQTQLPQLLQSPKSPIETSGA
jgi:hypothetical protein